MTNGLAALEQAAILRRLASSARNRTWEADRLLDSIAGLD